MKAERRLTNSYPAYEYDLGLDRIKASVTVHQYTKMSSFAPITGSRREIPGAIDYIVELDGEGSIDVNEVREKNGMVFPEAAMFESLDDRVFISKFFFDSMTDDQ